MPGQRDSWTGCTGTGDIGESSGGGKGSVAAGFEETLTCWKWFPVAALLVAVAMPGERRLGMRADVLTAAPSYGSGALALKQQRHSEHRR